MGRKLIPQELLTANGTGKYYLNLPEISQKSSPMIFGRRVIVLTPMVIHKPLLM